MAKWTITVAYDVPRVCHIDVEADSEAEAIRKAIAEAPQCEFETDWDASGNYYAQVFPELQTKHENPGAL